MLLLGLKTRAADGAHGQFPKRETPTALAISLGTLCSNRVPLASFEKYSCLASRPPCTMLKFALKLMTDLQHCLGRWGGGAQIVIKLVKDL